MSDQNNPYSKAAGAYGAASTVHAPDQRSLEGQILLKAAQKIEALATRLKNGEKVSLNDIGEIMEYNQKLWILFASDAGNPEHPLPQDVKNNIASLALFIFKRTNDFLIESTPEKLSALIEINRNIASGLMKRPDVPAAPSSNVKPAEKPAAKSPLSSPTVKSSADKDATDSLV